MELQIFQVDAFSDRQFRGNPAAVVPLDFWLDEETMLAIAAENNLAETAFFVPKEEDFHLRWFTPECEIDLCGHATLATAFVLFNYLGYKRDSIRFLTKSGELFVTRAGDLLTLDFPSRPPVESEPLPGLLEAIGRLPEKIMRARDFLLVYSSEEDVRQIEPNFYELSKIPTHAVIVTAPGNDCDFVSRFFAPQVGVSEDPVTGSAHCTLIPYWAERLGKEKLFARQISRRGGELYCELAGDRVRIGGKASLFLNGKICLEQARSKEAGR
ncbi:MAG: PhzF family phenazine biosynthesis protein [Pyrinomonadaceae bacterium]|jgi:PhzF family phenazine biosynthesis protein